MVFELYTVQARNELFSLSMCDTICDLPQVLESEMSDSPAAREYPPDFIKSVHAAADNVAWRFHATEDDELVFLDRLGVPHHVGLQVLFERYHHDDPAICVRSLTEHFRSVIALTTGNVNDDLNAQTDRLLVRVGHLPPRNPPVSIWHRPFPGTKLFITLALAQERGFRLVRTDMVTSSGKPEQHWYELGLTNLRQRTPPGAMKLLEPESGLLGCSVGDDCDGSRSLFVESLLSEPAPHGILAAIPHRNSLLALPLTRTGLLQKSLLLLKNMTESEYARSSYKLSDAIYWVKNGLWQPFGIEVVEGEVKLKLMKECAEAIRAVMG